MISIIGQTEKDLGIEYELVSDTKYGKRIIVNNDDIVGTLRKLSHSFFSLQDCK